jgi:hypothetical protein
MSALPPDLALRYLAELEPAIEAAAVLAADGKPLTGDASLAARLTAGGASAQGLLAARSSGHVVVALVPAGALVGLVQHDLEMVARALG